MERSCRNQRSGNNNTRIFITPKNERMENRGRYRKHTLPRQVHTKNVQRRNSFWAHTTSTRIPTHQKRSHGTTLDDDERSNYRSHRHEQTRSERRKRSDIASAYGEKNRRGEVEV